MKWDIEEIEGNNELADEAGFQVKSYQ